MKIYILNILPIQLRSKLTKLTNKFIHTEKIQYELHSPDFGLNVLDDKTIVRHEPIFETNYEIIKNYNGCDLLVDMTKYKQIIEDSQLPVNYLMTKMTCNEYKINKKSQLSLVVICLTELNYLNTDIIPIDFYFSYNSETNINLQDTINNRFFQEDFNVFLNELN
jgi:hypothetical protein